MFTLEPAHSAHQTFVLSLVFYNLAKSEGERAHLFVQARKQPSSHGELIEYLLSTEQPEMEYETARCRPLLTQDFLAFLQQEIGVPFCPA